MAPLKTVQLDLPARTEDLRNLEIGSVAYLAGRIFTAREGVYQRAIEDGAGMPASRGALGLANFHCSPAATVNPDGSYTVGAVTATAESRRTRCRSKRSRQPTSTHAAMNFTQGALPRRHADRQWHAGRLRRP